MGLTCPFLVPSPASSPLLTVLEAELASDSALLASESGGQVSGVRCLGARCQV